MQANYLPTNEILVPNILKMRNPITYCSAKAAKEHENLPNHSFSHSKQGHRPQQNREG
jgi:hypothetical protein